MNTILAAVPGTSDVPIEDIVKLVQQIYEKSGYSGVLGLIVLSIIALAIYELTRAGLSPFFNIKKWLNTSKDVIDLKKHFIFIQLDSLKDYKLGELRIPCPLRQALCQDMYKFRIEALRDSVRCLVHEDHTYDTQKELKLAVSDMLLTARINWRKAAGDLNLPELVINSYDNATSEVREVFSKTANDICESTTLYTTNDKRLCCVLDILGTIESHFHDALVNTLLSINGEISSIEYRGLKCCECQVCHADNSRANLLAKLSKVAVNESQH